MRSGLHWANGPFDWHQVEGAPAIYPSGTSDKSAVEEHNINLWHSIQLHHTIILSTKLRYMDHIIREPTEIELHANNMNREDGFCLRKSWKPLIYSLKDRRTPPSHDSRFGFSAEPRKSVHTALIRAQAMPSPGNHQPPPWCSGFSRHLCSLIPHRTPATQLPDTSVPCPTHPYTFSPVLFLNHHSRPLSGPS
jgi:hypothetical protein